MSAPLIEVKHVKKYFNVPAGKNHAVDDVSFTIEKGETLGVVGESGCGKSTLGRTIIRLQEATDGQVLLQGDDVTHVQGKKLRAVREKCQIIFQDPYSSLNPRMSINKTILEPLKHGGLSRGEQKEKAERLMDLVGIDKRLRESYPHELDGGRRQRVGIARALALDPEFIVCDEPVSALDVSIQAQVINLLHDLQKEFSLTYLFISHDLSVVEYISDKVGVMYLGKLVEYAPTKNLYGHPMHPYTESLLSAVPVADPEAQMERIPLEGEIPNPANPPSGCYFHTRCRYCTDKCKTEAPEYRELEPDHFVACHRAEELKLKGFQYE